MTKTLDEILTNFSQSKDYPELMYEESKNDSKQAILQWVADEVVGKKTLELTGGHYTHRNPLNTESATRDALIDEQRQILKAHGWKQ